MWTRKELKEKGKASFKLNYWKTVFAALVFALVCGGGASFAASGGGMLPPDSLGAPMAASAAALDGAGMDAAKELDAAGASGAALEGAEASSEADEAFAVATASLVAAAGVLAVVFLAIGVAVQAFLINPVEIGTRRFFVRNLNAKAEVKELAHGFDHAYLNGVKTLFLRDVFTFLWTLLLVVPGIVKSYEYRMIPYLLTEDPDMDRRQAFAESRRLMDGQKWRAFVLDLSFIGWEILSVLSFGIFGALYVEPYRNMTSAALYEALRYGEGMPEAARQAA